jgi:hypothetical protein
MPENFKFELGATVRDTVTGFVGVVAGRTQYLFGCNRYGVQAKVLHDGKPIEWQSFDELQLEQVKSAESKLDEKPRTGGWAPPVGDRPNVMR